MMILWIMMVLLLASFLNTGYHWSVISQHVTTTKFQWYFLFDEEGLLAANGFAPERNVGDYIDVPFEELPVPSRQKLDYWRK
jgi:hypothetical protein